jgi:hypothetical protein
VRAPDPAHLDELLAKARTQRLWEDPAWLRLGHWRLTPRGPKSEVDGLAFFRALRGKESPRAELEATLRGLFDARPVQDELDDAMCRFPARFAFLARRLGIDLARLPLRSCPRMAKFLERIAPRSVTLVFSAYYLNNPSSAFGHTFLRLNKEQGGAGVGRERELLDYGVDYSATVDTSNALVYGIKGLFGLFAGQFSHYAYYYKVREYADAESRDLWEYDLALEPDEVAMLAAHLWELGGTYFDYWYLDENCSFHVLGALEAAAPRLNLVEDVGKIVVVPSDTVRMLFRNPGLVRSVHWRPSIRTQFEARRARLSDRGLDGVEALARDPNAPLAGLSATEQVATLDAALDHVDLRFGKDLVLGKAPEAAKARQALLERRSALGIVSPPLEIVPPERASPELGHGSARMGIGGGATTKDGPVAILDLRLAMHDLLDPPDGYPAVAAMEFLPAKLRFLGREHRVEVDEAWLIALTSLVDVSRFELKPSWRFRYGAATVRDRACASCLASQGELGGGFSKLVGPLTIYAGGDLMAEWSPRLERNGIAGTTLRAGVGPGGLVRLRLGRWAALMVDARWRWLPDAAPRETYDLRGMLRFHLANAYSLAFEARRTPAADEATATLLAHF